MSGRRPPMPVNPALLQHAQKRRQSWENRVADQITRVTGSMRFVYLSRKSGSPPGSAYRSSPRVRPPPMIASLEAIFLSMFVMISQNRADQKRQVLADQQWLTVQDEEQQNEELLRLSTQILELTKASHATSTARTPDA